MKGKGKMVYVATDVHQKIKVMAAKKGLSMKEFVREAVNNVTRAKSGKPRKRRV